MVANYFGKKGINTGWVFCLIFTHFAPNVHLLLSSNNL